MNGADKMKVACIQMDIVFGDVEKNIENAKNKISEAMKARCYCLTRTMDDRI